MSFILVKPDDSEEYTATLLIQQTTGENAFDYSVNGSRLQSIEAGCRLCSQAESCHYSCIE